MNRLRSIIAVAVVAVFLCTPALPQASAAAAPATPTVFAGADYWAGFVEFWSNSLKKQNGVIMFALGVGAISLFIITRSKAKK